MVERLVEKTSLAPNSTTSQVGGHALEPKFQNHDTSGQILRLADETRRQQLTKALKDLEAVQVSTCKPAKVMALAQFLQRLITSLDDDAVASLVPQLPELESPDVKLVATTKVTQVFGQHEKIDIHHPAVQELILRLASLNELVGFIQSDGLNLIRQALPTGEVAMAADVNFYHYDFLNRQFHQSYKFDRLGQNITDQEFLNLWEKLKLQYCQPPGGKIRVIWDNAVVMLNGQVFNFHDRLEIISGPIDLVLLWDYLLEARENGLLYSSNSHFGLFECLVHNGQIKTIAALSDEEIVQGLTFESKRMSPVASDLKAALMLVLGNRPLRLIQ